MIVNAHIGFPIGCEALKFEIENPTIWIVGIIGNFKKICEKKRKPKTISSNIMMAAI
jgi:hypothetical protein